MTDENNKGGEGQDRGQANADDKGAKAADLERYRKENSDLVQELTSIKKALNEKLEAEKASSEAALKEQGKFKELAEAKEKEAAAAVARVTELEKQSALKVAAIQAGIIDIDGLKLADTSKISIDKSGKVEGVDAVLKELKESKPFLFGNSNAGGGSTGFNRDRLGDVDIRNLSEADIMKMTKDERQAVIAKMTGGEANEGKSAFTIARENALRAKK